MVGDVRVCFGGWLIDFLVGTQIDWYYILFLDCVFSQFDLFIYFAFFRFLRIFITFLTAPFLLLTVLLIFLVRNKDGPYFACSNESSTYTCTAVSSVNTQKKSFCFLNRVDIFFSWFLCTGVFCLFPPPPLDSDKRFYVVRGQVEKEWKAENGELESGIHSSGLLFGITDSMLNM